MTPIVKTPPSPVKKPVSIESWLPLPATPLKAAIIEASSFNTLNPVLNELVIEKDLLNTQPWYSNKNLVTGNPHIKQINTPVTFSINLQEFDSSTALYATKNTNGENTPLELRLNCSLSRFNLNMKHIINKTNTRTGFHLTFWGMEADVITGSGSTGAFMNQWGLTSLMSLANKNIGLDLKQALGITGSYSYNEDMFRVAAQDAFIELLSLFRNNGLTRYGNPLSPKTDSDPPNREKLDPSVYSETYGDSTYSRNANKNDIMVKGNVDFHYKSNLYQGYFKSLSWIMDSDNPFQWQFDFVFQVQKTFSQIYYPIPSALDTSSKG